MTAAERQALIEAVASARSTYKSLQRIARAALQVSADLEERLEQLERDLAINHTAQGGHSDSEDQYERAQQLAPGAC